MATTMLPSHPASRYCTVSARTEKSLSSYDLRLRRVRSTPAVTISQRLCMMSQRRSCPNSDVYFSCSQPVRSFHKLHASPWPGRRRSCCHGKCRSSIHLGLTYSLDARQTQRTQTRVLESYDFRARHGFDMDQGEDESFEVCGNSDSEN